MKSFLVAAVFLAALGGAAHAEEADDIRDIKAEAETFNARMYAGEPGNKAYACFVRRYDAEHLAHHPKQKVASMKLLISAEMDTEDKQFHNSFRLGFRYRHRSGDFDSSGSCHHAVFTKDGTEIRLGCGVDCEGGGIGVALSKDDKSAIVRLARVRVWQNNKPDDDAELSLVAGADDGIFRLDRTDNKECASLVTDRKELAALRHK
jgi:opacity protein-like surface antigen